MFLISFSPSPLLPSAGPSVTHTHGPSAPIHRDRVASFLQGCEPLAGLGYCLCAPMQDTLTHLPVSQDGSVCLTPELGSCSPTQQDPVPQSFCSASAWGYPTDGITPTERCPHRESPLCGITPKRPSPWNGINPLKHRPTERRPHGMAPQNDITRIEHHPHMASTP